MKFRIWIPLQAKSVNDGLNDYQGIFSKKILQN